MLDKDTFDTLERIWVQLENALDNFTKGYDHIYQVRINMRKREFLIYTYINIDTFNSEGNSVILYPLKMYLSNAEIPYAQTDVNEISVSENDAVKLLTLLRLEGY